MSAYCLHVLMCVCWMIIDLQDYLKPIQNKEVSIPAELEGREMIIFGNVHQIYDWHKE